MRARRWGRIAGALVVVITAACSSRPKVGTDHRKRDGGPSVVVVDRPKSGGGAAQAGPALAAVPVVEEQEPNDGVERAQPFEFPKGVQGRIGAPQPPPEGAKKKTPIPDIDVYQWLVGGEGRQAVHLVLSPVAGLKLALDVLDGDGARVASGGEAEGGAVMIPNLAVEAGRTYFLKVSERGKPKGAEQPYRLVATTSALGPGDEVEPNGDAAHATALAAGGEATGFYGAGRDEDWIKVTAESPPPEGSTLRVEVEGVDGVEPGVRVFDAAGALLSNAEGTRSQGLILRNAPYRADGVFVVLRAESGSSAELRWLLRTQIEPPLPMGEVEPNNTPALATPVVLGGAGAGETAATAVRGYLWPRDNDSWRLKPDAPGELRLELTPPEGSKVDLNLDVLGPGGKARVYIDDGGPGQPEILPTLYAGGEVVVRVGARSRESLVDAPYQLAWQLAPPGASEREPDGDAASATAVQAGAPVRGFLAPRGDEDWFVITTPEGGGRVRAALDREPPGTAPTIKIMDAKRAMLATARGTTATATTPAGNVFVVVRDAGKGSNPREPYQLTITFE